MRWLIAIALSFAVVSPADAGVFKSRGSKPADKPAAAPAAKKTTPAVKKAPAKQAAPATKKAPVASKAPAKKRGSAVAAKGRPDDLTPDVKEKKPDATITEEEDDVIIRDIDD